MDSPYKVITIVEYPTGSTGDKISNAINQNINEGYILSEMKVTTLKENLILYSIVFYKSNEDIREKHRALLNEIEKFRDMWLTPFPVQINELNKLLDQAR